MIVPHRTTHARVDGRRGRSLCRMTALVLAASVAVLATVTSTNLTSANATLANVALPDEVKLTNGAVIEGKVVSATAAEVKVKTKMGVVSFPRARVASIVYKKTPSEIFEERFAKVGVKDVAGFLELAEWAKSKSLRKEARRAFEKVVSIEPDHAAARKALGHVKYDGKWMTKREAAEAKALAAAAAKRADGLVKYQGEWVTLAEKEAREKGWVKHDGKWMPVEDANRAKGLVRVGDRWVRREVADLKRFALEYEKIANVKFFAGATKHIRVLSVFDAEHAQKVADAGEKAFEICRTKLRHAGSVLPPSGSVTSFLFRRQGPYARVTAKIGELTKQNADWIKYAQRLDGFLTNSEPYVTCEHLAFRKPEHLVHGVIYKLGALFLGRIHFTVSLPPNWTTAGFQSWLEIETLGSCWNTPYAIGYGAAQGKGDRWQKSDTWKPALRDIVVGRQDRPLAKLMGRQTNQLDRADLMKSWSVVDWLIRTNPEGFDAYLKEVRRRFAAAGKPGTLNPRAMREADQAALEKALGKKVGLVDEDWRKYVSANY